MAFKEQVFKRQVKADGYLRHRHYLEKVSNKRENSSPKHAAPILQDQSLTHTLKHFVTKMLN